MEARVQGHPQKNPRALAGESSWVGAFSKSLLAQGQGPLPQASPQSLGNTLSPAAERGVCSMATATCLVGPGWPAWPLRGPFIHRATMLAFQVDMGLEFPQIALGAPVTTYPEAQDRAPGLCCSRIQEYHLCFGQMQPPSVPGPLGYQEAGSLMVKASHLNHPDPGSQGSIQELQLMSMSRNNGEPDARGVVRTQ